MSMICEVCHEAIATVHLTEIVNNAKKEIHLCEACAEQKGVAIHSHVKNISIPEFFGQLVEPREKGDGGDEQQCDQCGLSYRQFRAGGKLGCPRCYDVFRGDMHQLMERIHASTRHRGKVPVRVDAELRRRRELQELREELSSAVAQEEYELAASLRDKIHELERESQCN